MASPLSQAEKKWLKKHYRGEYYFLRTYGLSIYKVEDREEGRQILRQLMMDENEDESLPSNSSDHELVIPTWYDETNEQQPCNNDFSIQAIGRVTHLEGQLEHHTPESSGAVSICIGNGNGVFISAAVYDSIPEAHRPPVSLTQRPYVTTFNSVVQALGSTVVPILLVDRSTGRMFRVKLRALVMPELTTGMFIALFHNLVAYASFTEEGVKFQFRLDDGRVVDV